MSCDLYACWQSAGVAQHSVIWRHSQTIRNMLLCEVFGYVPGRMAVYFVQTTVVRRSQTKGGVPIVVMSSPACPRTVHVCHPFVVLCFICNLIIAVVYVACTFALCDSTTNDSFPTSVNVTALVSDSLI
jgi:hypothetical protein